MTMTDLNATAAVISERLRAHGFPAEGAVLCLAEEAGEFVGAYRRWSGQARRPGSVEDVRAELADVVLAAYVTAHEMGITLAADPVAWPAIEADEAGRAVLDVVAAVSDVVAAYQIGVAASAELASVVDAAAGAALVLGIDLDRAITAKLAVLATRGWRAPATVEPPRHTVPCGFACGYLATGESDLDEHEARCEHTPDAAAADEPAPRPARVSPRPSGPRAAGGAR